METEVVEFKNVEIDQNDDLPISQNEYWTIAQNEYWTNKKHFIRHFLDLKGNKSVYTAKNYELDIKDFFNVINIEDISISHIRSVNIMHAEDFILNLAERGMSSATINRKISSLSALYRWMLKFQDNSTNFEIIKFNPFGNLREERPVINNKETEFLTKKECKELLASINTSSILGYRNKTIIALALTTALRKSELINIKLKDISTYNGYNVIKIVRKGGKEDLVKLQSSIKIMIEEYVKKTDRDFKDNRDEYLFIGHSTNGLNKTKLDSSTLNYMMKKVCKDGGINKNLRVHSTRHTAITLAIMEGVTIEKVREFAGHKNLATTNRYVHSVDKLKDNAGDYIDIL